MKQQAVKQRAVAAWIVILFFALTGAGAQTSSGPTQTGPSASKHRKRHHTKPAPQQGAPASPPASTLDRANPANPDPRHPGTPPVLPDKKPGEPYPVKPPDPTKPTLTKPPR